MRAHRVREAEYRPLVLVRDLRQLAIGVDGVGVTHGLEHRDVGLGVGVGERFIEVDVALLGEFADGDGLVLALGEELHLAGELAVLVDLRSRRDRAGDAEQFGERFDDLGRATCSPATPRRPGPGDGR